MIVGGEQMPDFPAVFLPHQIGIDLGKGKAAVSGTIRISQTVKAAIVANVFCGFAISGDFNIRRIYRVNKRGAIAQVALRQCGVSAA